MFTPQIVKCSVRRRLAYRRMSARARIAAEEALGHLSGDLSGRRSPIARAAKCESPPRDYFMREMRSNRAISRFRLPLRGRAGDDQMSPLYEAAPPMGDVDLARARRFIDRSGNRRCHTPPRTDASWLHDDLAAAARHGLVSSSRRSAPPGRGRRYHSQPGRPRNPEASSKARREIGSHHSARPQRFFQRS